MIFFFFFFLSSSEQDRDEWLKVKAYIYSVFRSTYLILHGLVKYSVVSTEVSKASVYSQVIQGAIDVFQKKHETFKLALKELNVEEPVSLKFRRKVSVFIIYSGNY